MEEHLFTQQEWKNIFYNLATNGHLYTKDLQKEIASYIAIQTEPPVIKTGSFNDLTSLSKRINEGLWN